MSNNNTEIPIILDNLKLGQIVELTLKSTYTNRFSNTITGTIILLDATRIVIKDAEQFVFDIPKKYVKYVKIVRDGYSFNASSDREKYDNIKPYVTTTAGESLKLFVLNTGGTISSSASAKGETPGQFLQKSFEKALKNHTANHNIEVVCDQMSQLVDSTDIETPSWTEIGTRVNNALKKENPDGIMILHGTDSMMYDASYVSFMTQNSYCPIVYVGAQLSTDRPATDTIFNIERGITFALRGDSNEVGICMHRNASDLACDFNRGTRALKTSTGRRGTFKTLDGYPIATIYPNFVKYDKTLDYYYLDRSNRNVDSYIVGPRDDDKINYTTHEIGLPKRGTKINNEMHLDTDAGFEKSVGFYWAYPGQSYSALKNYLESYNAVVIAGVGLGHMQKPGRQIVKRYIQNGGIVVMTTQVPHGGENANVYEVGVELLNAGAWRGQTMLPHVAYTKLLYAINKYSSKEDVKKYFYKNQRREMVDRLWDPMVDMNEKHQQELLKK